MRLRNTTTIPNNLVTAAAQEGRLNERGRAGRTVWSRRPATRRRPGRIAGNAGPCGGSSG